jgi:phosphatidylserine/phosphatidylglycerophosphate/cardiolipin synthase-like enzyme
MTFPGRFEVKQAMEQLLRDTRYSKYSVAMAYIDSMGADMLAEMLRRRDASLTLIVPRTPNVYHDANRKALKRLVDVNASRRSGDSNNLKIFLIDDMLHAKVLYAESEDESVADFGMLGSCNLKQRSLGQFVELNASIRQPALTMALRRQLVQLVEESLPLTKDDLVFSEPKATIEEWLG